MGFSPVKTGYESNRAWGMTFVTGKPLTAEGAENAEEEGVILAADERGLTLI